MKKKLYLGIFVFILVFGLISLSYAKDNVERASTLVSRALKLANKGDYERMIELCTEAIEVAPGYSMGYLTRATGYFALGEGEKARADLKRAELAKIEEDKAPALAKGYEGKDTTGRHITVARRETANATVAPAYSIYFRPGVRFGTDSRTLYIMDLLVPIYQDEKNILFGNTKYTPNDRSGWEINAGMGYRRLLWEDQLILGANAYYDRRKTDWGTDHEQWGIGLEAMADIPLESFDLGLTARLNYYHPISDTNIDGLGTEYARYSLSDTGIIFEGGRVEEPMRGIDYEAGMRIPYISDYVETWAYAGGYHYHGKLVDDVNGFMARLEVIPTDFMRLNYEFHHDNYSKAEHYGEVMFEVPFSIGNLVTGRNPFEGIGDMMTGSRELSERMVEPVRRDVDVKVIVDEDNENVPGAGEKMEGIVFVSETGSDVTGDGTKDNPYATISYALANDARIIAGAVKTIHVMNSSTVAVVDEAATPGLLTLSIADFLIWGSGANHPKYANIVNMPYKGHPTINDMLTLNAANPTVTGLGFDIEGVLESCINILSGAGGSGIKITNNLFEMSRTGSAYGIYSDFAGALGTEESPVIIASNRFNVESTGDYAYGILLRTSGAGNDIFAKITDNDMSGGIWGDEDAYGIYLISFSGIGSETNPVTVSGNSMAVTSNSSACGIHFYASNDVFAAITGNDMSGGIWGDDNAWGISLYSGSGGSTGSETSPVTISGNRMAVTGRNNYAYGIYFNAQNDIFAAITGNDMSGGIWGDGSAHGIYLESGSGDIGSEAVPLTVSGNSMVVTGGNNDAYGIRFYVGNDIFAAITGNDMSGGISGYDDAYGIYLTSGVGGIGSETGPVTVSGNRMVVTGRNNDAYGIRFYAGNDIFAAITGNDMSGGISGYNDARGIYLSSNSGIGSETSPVTVSGNSMAVTSRDDEAYGIRMNAGNDIFAAITGNDMSGGISGYNDARGIYLYSGTGGIGSETSPVIVSGNSMAVTSRDEEAYGIRILANNDIFAAITGNDMSGGISGYTDAYGIYLVSNSGIGSEASPVTVSGNRLAVTGRNGVASGICFYAVNDIFAAITGNDMSGGISGYNDAHGIYLDSGTGIGSEAGPVTVSGNRLAVRGRNSDAYGIYFNADNDIFAKITGNDMSGGISGNYFAYGIYLSSISGGNAGSETSPVTISGNNMAVRGRNLDVYGIRINATNDIFTAIYGNRMDILAADDAWGVYLRSISGNIGSLTAPTLFIGNSGTIGSSGGINIYLLELNGGVAGSYVNWKDNSFDVLMGGVWSGNYPGANGPVYLNGYGGTIIP